MVIVYLADGFEELEALAPVDILRRAGEEVCLAGVGGLTIIGARGVQVTVDSSAEEADVSKARMIVLPGGPGHTILDASAAVDAAIKHCVKEGKYLAAICAAPSILGKRGLLDGRRGTCFPGYEKYCAGMILTRESVCVDGNIVTARGAGVSLEFGYKLVELLFDRAKATEIAQSMQFAGRASV